MRRSSDFGATVRAGRRAGTRTLVVHVLEDRHEGSPVVGFIVSKAVGGAAVRNRTKRRLRALMRPLIPAFAPGTRLVVRANPPAASASSAALERDLVAALRRAEALRPAERDS
jgi:ribonuclease P protein component